VKSSYKIPYIAYLFSIPDIVEKDYLKGIRRDLDNFFCFINFEKIWGEFKKV